jgi:hypothetical protein
MSDKLRHFLLVFDHNEGRLIQNREFNNSEEALTAYSATERSYTREQNVEVVLIGADSIETVQRTHANYFDHSIAESVQKYLVGLTRN